MEPTPMQELDLLTELVKLGDVELRYSESTEEFYALYQGEITKDRSSLEIVMRDLKRIAGLE